MSMNPTKSSSKPTHISIQHFGFHSINIFISSSALTMTSFVSTLRFFLLFFCIHSRRYTTETVMGWELFFARASGDIKTFSTICIPCAPWNRSHSLLLFTVVGWVPLLFHIILVIITLKMCIILKSLPWNLCATNVKSTLSGWLILLSSEWEWTNSAQNITTVLCTILWCFCFLFVLSCSVSREPS